MSKLLYTLASNALDLIPIDQIKSTPQSQVYFDKSQSFINPQANRLISILISISLGP